MKLFILFQTDIYKSRSNRVLFGVYESFDLANTAAKENNLYNHNSEVIIDEIELNEFKEI